MGLWPVLLEAEDEAREDEDGDGHNDDDETQLLPSLGMIKTTPCSQSPCAGCRPGSADQQSA